MPRAYDEFKKVRNRIRKHNAEEIVFACISRLMKPGSLAVNQMKYYPPWVLLLLVKWAIIYGEFHSHNRQPLNEREFNYLINLIHDLSGALRLPNEYEHHFLFLRNLAFQQFWLQDAFSELFLSRQSLLFRGLGRGHPFSETFLTETRITIMDFIHLAIGLMKRFYTEGEMFVRADWFRTIERSFPPGSVDCFLSAISRNFDSLRGYLSQKRSNDYSIQHEFYEETPLKRFPLLRHGDKYYCYLRELLFHSLNTFVYDLLRSVSPDTFMTTFGRIFEQYVKNAVSYSNIPFVTETELKANLGNHTKTVDFLLVDDDANILVDAKGVEMAHLGRVTYRTEVIRDKTSSSILKAVEQAYEAACLLSHYSQCGDLTIGRKSNYLLVVTFKDFYVGNGTDFHAHIAGEKLDDIVRSYGGKFWIPLEHMYFLSISELELLIQLVKDGKTSLAACLKEAVEADKNPATKKWNFGLHIAKYYPGGGPHRYPQYLVDEFNLIYGSFAQRLAD